MDTKVIRSVITQGITKVITVATAGAAAAAVGIWRVNHKRQLDRAGGIERSVTIDAPVSEVDGIVREVGSWPHYIDGIDTVERENGDRWRVRVPGGGTAHVSVTETSGAVRFHVTGEPPVVRLDGLTVRAGPAPDDLGCEVRATLPAPSNWGRVALVTGTDPAALVEIYLRRLKQRVEVGFVTTVSGQPAARSGVSARAQELLRRQLQTGGRP